MELHTVAYKNVLKGKKREGMDVFLLLRSVGKIVGV